MNGCRRILVVVLTLLTSLLLGSCSPSPDKVTLTFWHFWSEPAQRKALQSLVDDYEQSHPGIVIQLTDLAWSDGKTKLQLAFNANSQPDVIHLGLDWHAEFARSNVFAPIESSIPVNRTGALWVVNARALLRWDGVNADSGVWGLCANDHHNVLKRTLPLLWSAGAKRFYTKLPISDAMDTSLVQALWFVRGLANRGAIIEQGRMLDQGFLQKQITQLYTGAWMMDMATAQHVQGFSVIPTKSILNGDVLSISKSSLHHAQAEDFIRWLTSYDNAKRFCLAVSDAGVPADPKVFADSSFAKTAWQKGFLETIHLSSPLPTSSSILSIEPVLEQLIERCYHAKSIQEVAMLTKDARMEVIQIEHLAATPP